MDIPKWLNPDELPNLDGIIDPQDALEQAESFRQVAMVLEKLKAYATSKSMAMRFRLAGNIGLEKNEEADCERIYKTLPEWARW